MEDNTMWTCESKSRDGVRIIGYTLMDEGGNRKYVKPQELKNAMFNNWVQVDNLKLTRDGRLIDCTPEEAKQENQFRTITSIDEARALIDAYYHYWHSIAGTIGYAWGKKNNKEELKDNDFIKNNKDLLGAMIINKANEEESFFFAIRGNAYVNINGELQYLPCLRFVIQNKVGQWDDDMNNKIKADCGKTLGLNIGVTKYLTFAVTAKLTRNLAYGNNSVPYVDYNIYVGYETSKDSDKDPIKCTAFTKSIEDHVNAGMDLNEIYFYRNIAQLAAQGKIDTFSYDNDKFKQDVLNMYKVNGIDKVKMNVMHSALGALQKALSLDMGDTVSGMRNMMGVCLFNCMDECIHPNNKNGKDKDSKTIRNDIDKLNDGFENMQKNKSNFLNDPLLQDGIVRAQQSTQTALNDKNFSSKAAKNGLFGAFKRS